MPVPLSCPRVRRLVLFLVACSSAPVPASEPTNRATTSSIDAARAAERGIGGPRDYERAATIYEAQCDRGHGEVEACLDLMDAIAHSRGRANEPSRVLALDEVLCARRVAVSCMRSILVKKTTHHGDRVGYDEAAKRVADACETTRRPARVRAVGDGWQQGVRGSRISAPGTTRRVAAAGWTRAAT